MAIQSNALLFAEESDHFKAITSLPVARGVLEVAESVWQPALSSLGVESLRLDEKLEIHLYADAELYQAAELRLTGGRFRENLAFTHAESKSAHICLQPRCSKEVLDKLGLPNLTRRLIAHEATHLIGYAAIPNYGELPDWLTDGIASSVDDQVMRAKNWSAGPGKDPFSSMYELLVQRLLKEGKLPSAGSIFLEQSQVVSVAARYGVRWLFIRFLTNGNRAKQFDLLRKKIGATKSGSDRRDLIRSAAEELYGDLNKLDSEFQRYVEGLKPEWDEVYRSLSTCGKDWTQIAFANTNAQAWRTKSPSGTNYKISGGLTILPNISRQMNLLIGRSDDGFISIAFVAGYGVTIFNYKSTTNEWDRLENAELKSIATDRPFDFRAEIKKDHIQLFVDGKSAVSISLNKRSMKGQWGLGAQAGSAGIWSKISISEIKPPTSAPARTRTPKDESSSPVGRDVSP